MKVFRVLILLTVAGVATVEIAAQRRSVSRGNRSSVDVAAALASAAPDLDQRLTRFKVVRMPFNAAGLTARERQMIDQLVIACRYLESMYWRQSDPDGLALYKALAGNTTPVARSLRRYLTINGSRWDLVNENRPFVGTMPMPPGHALYAPDISRAEIERYVAAHPDKKAEVYNPYAFVRRQGQDLVGRAYHDDFKQFVTGAATALRQAASLSADPTFAKFLRMRADALFTDDYYPSDVAWVELQNPKFDVIFAPYETYLDDLLGVKTSYGAAILIRNDAESQNLAKYQQWVPDIQDALPLAPADRPSVRGHVTPMEVMEFNYLSGQGAIVQSGGRYAVVYAKMPGAIERLAKELLEQEATGDRRAPKRGSASTTKCPRRSNRRWPPRTMCRST
jgi:hypothetical protein